jgi:hypothetical protein
MKPEPNYDEEIISTNEVEASLYRVRCFDFSLPLINTNLLDDWSLHKVAQHDVGR